MVEQWPLPAWTPAGSAVQPLPLLHLQRPRWSRRYASALDPATYGRGSLRRPPAQIKVRDFSRAQVTITPAEFGSWEEARSELLKEAKRPLKAQLDAELATAVDDAAVKECRDAFAQREAAIEHDIDHEPLEMHLQLGVSYNVSQPAAHAV